MKYRKILFIGAFLVAISSSFAFKTTNAKLNVIAYYDNFDNQCVQGDLNDPFGQCSTTGHGQVCTIYDPDQGVDVTAFSTDFGIGVCGNPYFKQF